ncbi:sortilin-related receptor [Dendroctonus ponderosae]|uniref:Sortilin-related receptor n=1 Tax=Dendroctonus ponderosae TaxID=77166 RepID=U4UYT9_DENPD|nr:sortilin-related receptor [Dendroctonus ponderosae]ERL95566.1 hypothetical protein D910_12827 [Dendroctonus ponderosae]
MRFIFILLIFSPFFATNSEPTKTLYGNLDTAGGRTFNFFLDEEPNEDTGGRYRRASNPEMPVVDDLVDTKINHLNDSHKQLMVHWVGDKSKVIICLARDPLVTQFDPKLTKPSAVFISFDDGDSYADKSDQFKLPNGRYALLDKFYNHPTLNSQFVFTDIVNNLLFITTDYGKTFQRIELKFTPSEVSFHDLQPSMFLILDKNDTQQRLWITEDLGASFRLAHEFVKAMYWIKSGDNAQLLLHRNEPNGRGSIIYSNNLFKNRVSEVYATNIQDFFLKGDYLFTTKNGSSGLELYVSHLLSKQLLCMFDTALNISNFFVADVTGSRALVAASHSPTSSNLYVSDNLGGTEGKVRFTLSIKDVFAFFPNTTWKGTLVDHVSDEPFADVYKVEGMTGIYIASKVVSKPTNGNNQLGPHHLGSVITYDHGATWRLVQPPANDVEGQDTGCLPSKNCSLHLSQKFSQIYPESRSVPIQSSKSAPGTIIATGVLGQNLKGHYGVYISVDGGLSWRQTLRELYFFNMGDHGGVLSAVKYYKSNGETRHILYSTDEGENWNQTQFHNEEIRLYGLMTEPGENTTVFTMFGSLPKEHSWIIVKVNLTKVFPRVCTDKDYKMWTPSKSDDKRSYIPCVMGQQVTYERRMRHANCLNGLDYVRVLSKKPCSCDVFDFECDFGFIRVDDTIPRCIRDKSLENVDPYAVPYHFCQPGSFYERSKGYRKISGDKCVEGFEQHYLPDILPCPFQEADDFLLFALRENISRYNLVSNTLEPLPIKNLKNVIAVEFDMSTNCVYWADINLDTINRQCFSNGSRVETLVSHDLASVEGMALDWISKTLYFVDGNRVKIELIRTDINHSGRMRRTILDNKDLKKPRGIAVHPPAGYLFWTDWSTEDPCIKRANLDGSNVTLLFDKEKVEWPNGITVDYVSNRIYWVDARKDYIGSSDLQGGGMVYVVESTDIVPHPFGVAVFKNDIYWDDWKKNAIFKRDKDMVGGTTGIQVVLENLPGLMDLKVFTHGLQTGHNACSNLKCSHICVGLPHGSVCLCPDGMITTKDGTCLCPGSAAPLANGTCTTVGNSCSPDHFACTNRLCIPKGWNCDGEDDCGDNSDEDRCNIATCPPSFHSCGDGKCLPHYWKCDYETDCVDGSDEVNCPRQNCTDSQFSCDNGRCISKSWRCDGENDCRDNTDERNCDPDRPTQCKGEDEFQCKSGAVTCIPSTWKCDGEPDCRDGSDETGCTENVCSEFQFSCGPPQNRCIFNTWLCDGDRDCTDGRDELNCTTPKTEVTKFPNGFLPSQNDTCQEWMFKCKNDRCIPFWWKCDEVNDCGDGSDEAGCSKADVEVPQNVVPNKRPPVTLCKNNQFRCSTGQCILSAWLCDHSFDCPNGEDEQNCSTTGMTCPQNHFKCAIDGSCISRALVCNGIANCPDQSDEKYCDQPQVNEPATPSCSLGYFPCDGGSCHPLSVMCDGRPNCFDGYDERNCSSKSIIFQVMDMQINLFYSDENSLWLSWGVSPFKPEIELEFLPSICQVGVNQWRNVTWTNATEIKFKDLLPYTAYNMTVFVRQKGKTTVFPPAKYFVVTTDAGKPSPPVNVKAKQLNGSQVLISWDPPVHPNGIIEKYRLSWTRPESRPITLALMGNKTSHRLTADFQDKQSYIFTVSAMNNQYMSNQSAPVRLTFDGQAELGRVANIHFETTSNKSTIISWNYQGPVDGFILNITTEDFRYPRLPSYSTQFQNITLNLAPGETYYTQIFAFRNHLVGPAVTYKMATPGAPLPSVEIVQIDVVKPLGTSVKLSWKRPEKAGKAAWQYGVYYGTTMQELLAAVRYQTPQLTATVNNLDACESYFFAVGFVEPYGIGPLWTNVNSLLTTSWNPRAPPKKLRVQPEGADNLKMAINWEPSCLSQDKADYIVTINERASNRTWRIMVSNKLSHKVAVEAGGVYNVTVSTATANATPTSPVEFEAPPIYPPCEVRVIPEANGSFFVYWQESESMPRGNFAYEVLVQEGNGLNEATAEKYTVKHPPFIYTNSLGSTFTFSVRIKTEKGFSSLLSETVSKFIERPPAGSSMLGIIVPSLLVLLALVGVIAFLIIRNRRLHNSFVRFANSHYNSRSDAATFDDNSLDEEDSPRIVGFSDDEPLVVA